MNDTNLVDAMQALDMGGLSPKEQESLLLDLNSLIFRGSMVRLVERMDESAREQFSKLVDKGGSEDQIEAFLQAHVPDADAAVAEAVKEISDDILAVTGTK